MICWRHWTKRAVRTTKVPESSLCGSLVGSRVQNLHRDREL